MEYSVELCKELEQRFHGAQIYRPMRIARFDAGDELTYNVTGVAQANTARVRLRIDKFVGGGFAGQVYRVKALAIDPDAGPIDALAEGRFYAMKILIPPTGFSRLFRNLLYWIGFQGPFQLQVNPHAARAGALWQKFIRRGAKIRFGDENAVVDIHATFVDEKLGSCGEISEWIDGRTWRLEVDDRVDFLKAHLRGRPVDPQNLGSAEYLAKRTFMRRFVELLNDMGAFEFARQYEWSTCKSQPNCLKREGADGDPSAGLVAVDFRAGLALLPFLPMSPGDFKLILKGLARGSLVQFDRGSLARLEAFVNAHDSDFADMRPIIDELKKAEKVYRNSVPDITHNHIRLLYSPRLWSTMLASAVTGWKVRNILDEKHEQKFRRSKISTLLFLVLGLVPLLGTFFRRLWGRADWRRHYRAMATSPRYLRRAVFARAAEKTIIWHRAGRLEAERALKVAQSLPRFLGHLCLAILPAGLHRFLTDHAFRNQKLAYIFVRPFKLYFNAALREQWLRDMVQEGRNKHVLTDDDAETILAHLKEPYVQRYLVSLVVHLLTLPLTQIVSLIVSFIYWKRTGDELGAGGILVLFQVIPISPGSIARGLYAVGIAIYDRSFKDYNIAVFLSFFKYIGYLAFPIQMTYRYPVLARFMAAHWATEAVHVVPVFGERGALLEHWVYTLFYNWPLTVRRRMRKRAALRAEARPRYWHVALCAAAAASVFALADFAYAASAGEPPGLRDIWYLAALLPMACGAVVTGGCAGATLWKRIAAAVACGAATGLLYTVITATLVSGGQATPQAQLAKMCAWRVLLFSILCPLGAVLAELRLPDPDVP